MIQSDYKDRYRMIGKNVHQFRVLQHMTQEKLAEVAMVSVAYISKIERADLNRGFSCTMLMKIADALHVPVCVLMGNQKCQAYIACLAIENHGR